LSLIRVGLTAKGLANIPPSKIQRDFAFILGDTPHFCPSYVADFLSTTVSRFHALDCTIAEFLVTTNDPSNPFEEFLALG
jgi:hypothetical protein